METLERVIDRGAKLCEGQKKLAYRIGTTPSNLSAARHGKRGLTAEQLERLAAVVQMDSGDIWKIARQSRKPKLERQEQLSLFSGPTAHHADSLAT